MIALILMNNKYVPEGLCIAVEFMTGIYPKYKLSRVIVVTIDNRTLEDICYTDSSTLFQLTGTIICANDDKPIVDIHLLKLLTVKAGYTVMV